MAEGKGKEKLGDEEVHGDGDDDRVAMMHAEACAPPPESKMPEGKSLKESFRAYEFLLERRKPHFREDDADNDFRGELSRVSCAVCAVCAVCVVSCRWSCR
jgi:hypothetical protein